MYGKLYQQPSEQYPNFASLKRTPELQSKSYSFKDPLFESFGNSYLSKANLPEQQKTPNKNLKHKKYQNEDDEQVIQEAMEVAEKFALVKSMIKITKPICSPSVLLVNTQNKAKTQMILQAKQKNTDADSQILCENANKYLKFLDLLKNEQLKYPSTIKTSQISDNEVKINLESRIQNRTLPFSNQSYFLSNTNPYSKDFSSKGKESQSYNLQKLSIKNDSQIDHSFADESFPYSKQSESITHQNGSLINEDRSKYLISYQKESHATYTSQNTDQMFQRIQTPKIYQDKSGQKPYFTPFQESNPSKSRTKQEKIDMKKYRKFEKQPQSSGFQNSKNQKFSSNISQRENVHNQKMNKDFKIEPSHFSRNSSQVKKELNRSSSSKSQSYISQYKGREQQKVNMNEKKQKIKIGKDVKKQEATKNLAFKVLDKTSQFEKMLKMASSRINPT